MSSSQSTARAAEDLRESILADGALYYSPPQVFVRIPSDRLPANAKGRRVSELDAAVTAAENRLRSVDDMAEDAVADLTGKESSETRRDEAARKIAAGDTADVFLPSFNEADYLATVEVHFLAVRASRKALRDAVDAYNAAAAEIAADVLPTAVAASREANEAAAVALAAARTAMSKDAAARELTFSLRSVEVLAAIKATGYRSPYQTTSPDLARIIVGSFQTVTDAEASAARDGLDVLADVLTRQQSEDPSAPWTATAIATAYPEVAAGLGLKPQYAKKVSWDEYRIIHARATAAGQMPPAVPAHLQMGA